MCCCIVLCVGRLYIETVYMIPIFACSCSFSLFRVLRPIACVLVELYVYETLICKIKYIFSNSKTLLYIYYGNMFLWSHYWCHLHEFTRPISSHFCVHIICVGFFQFSFRRRFRVEQVLLPAQCFRLIQIAFRICYTIYQMH